MGLKQDIVVVNEYTIKNGKGGSRGGTPGDYVLRYMGRDGATEIVTPVTYDNEDYIMRYMARKDAVEQAGTEEEMRAHMREQKMGGVAFSGRALSLSHKDLIRSSKDIQKAFDKGKTVMKTVISFDEAYLRKNGILPEGFVHTGRGDFRGNIDQLKLRYAIQNGMEHLSKDYDDLQYVGVIQVDTDHVHCHLAMCDMGVGNLAADGTQVGKLSDKAKTKLRRGIDLALDEAKEVQYMASHVGVDKRNIQTNIKRYTYEQTLLYGAPQRIMSVLPDDERLWRASTNRKEMQKANKICRDYVEEILSRPDSGIDATMTYIRDYAQTRQKREGLSHEQMEELVVRGRETLVEGCMNGIYTVLKQIPKERREVSTLFLDLTSSPYVSPSFQNDVQDFVYKMSAYSSRLDKHRKEVDRYNGFIDDYEKSMQSGQVSDESAALWQFFLVEREYHIKTASKYSQFLFFEEPEDDLMAEYMEVVKYAKRVEGMEQLSKDASAKKMDPVNLEEYGRMRYDVYGGRFLKTDPGLYEKRLDKLRNAYESRDSLFHSKLASRNLYVKEEDGKEPVIARKAAYDFNDVRGLDLQDIRGDFNMDLEFDSEVREQFMDMAMRRIKAYDEACAYLDDTGQGGLKSVFDAQDVEAMRDVYEILERGGVLTQIPVRPMQLEHKKVVGLNAQMHRYLSNMVRRDVQAFEAAEAMNLGMNE